MSRAAVYLSVFALPLVLGAPAFADFEACSTLRAFNETKYSKAEQTVALSISKLCAARFRSSGLKVSVSSSIQDGFRTLTNSKSNGSIESVTNAQDFYCRGQYGQFKQSYLEHLESRTYSSASNKAVLACVEAQKRGLQYDVAYNDNGTTFAVTFRWGGQENLTVKSLNYSKARMSCTLNGQVGSSLKPDTDQTIASPSFTGLTIGPNVDFLLHCNRKPSKEATAGEKRAQHLESDIISLISDKQSISVVVPEVTTITLPLSVYTQELMTLSFLVDEVAALKRRKLICRPRAKRFKKYRRKGYELEAKDGWKIVSGRCDFGKYLSSGHKKFGSPTHGHPLPDQVGSRTKSGGWSCGRLRPNLRPVIHVVECKAR